MDPTRELPYWPAAMALLIEAGQMTASDYVPICPNLLLASEGASTEDIINLAHLLPLNAYLGGSAWVILSTQSAEAL